MIRNLNKKLSALITKFDKVEIFERFYMPLFCGGKEGDVQLRINLTTSKVTLNFSFLSIFS